MDGLQNLKSKTLKLIWIVEALMVDLIKWCGTMDNGLMGIEDWYYLGIWCNGIIGTGAVRYTVVIPIYISVQYGILLVIILSTSTVPK